MRSEGPNLEMLWNTIDGGKRPEHGVASLCYLAVPSFEKRGYFARGISIGKAMNVISKGLLVTVALIAVISTATSASAISVELAKKCRAMALKAYPPKLPGVKSGNAQAQRTFYEQCIANGGTMPASENQTTPAPASK